MRICFIALAALALTGATTRAEEKSLTIDGYAAVVNKRVITVGDVLDYIAPGDRELRSMYSGSELTKQRVGLFTNGVNQLVEQALIICEFEKLGGKIPDRMVNDRINQIIIGRFQNDRAALLRMLAEQHMTMEEWRDKMRDNVVIGFLRRQEVTDKIRITPGQIQEAYERNKAKYATPDRVKLSMIVLSAGDTDSERAAKRELAVRLRGQLLTGESFAELARAHSQDSKAAAGGAWGWMETSMLRDEIKAGTAKMKAGDLSDVIVTKDNLYLVKLEARDAAGVKPLESVRTELEDELRQAEGQRLYAQWIKRLKKTHYYHLYDHDAAADT
jgi:parvulin-like peptidyl-prolyl isomerase